MGFAVALVVGHAPVVWNRPWAVFQDMSLAAGGPQQERWELHAFRRLHAGHAKFEFANAATARWSCVCPHWLPQAALG